MTEQTNDVFLGDFLRQALDEIGRTWKSDWCLQRIISPFKQPRHNETRKASDPKTLDRSINPDDLAEGALEPEPQLIILEENRRTWQTEPPLVLPPNSPAGVTPFQKSEMQGRLVCNKDLRPAMVQLHPIRSSYYISAFASFFLSKVNPSTATSFSMAALSLHPNPSEATAAGPGQFDFTLLDPPWGNRSVRRSRTYSPMRVDDDPMETLGWLLEQHIAPDGLVAIWITNKESIRGKALDAFRTWNVRTIEEWVWLKVTIDGKPVTEIDGIWRKPCETLLIGRRNGSMDTAHRTVDARRDVKRRVIVAVPGLHSQKPNLKELIDPFMQHRGEYRALEIFARNLTTGWVSWGDEVLKYNWEGHWLDDDIKGVDIIKDD